MRAPGAASKPLVSGRCSGAIRQNLSYSRFENPSIAVWAGEDLDPGVKKTLLEHCVANRVLSVGVGVAVTEDRVPLSGVADG